MPQSPHPADAPRWLIPGTTLANRRTIHQCGETGFSPFSLIVIVLIAEGSFMSRWMIGRCLVAANVALLAGGCGASAAAPDGQKSVLLFAAASTSDALGEIKRQFEQEFGIAVHTNLGASSALAQQIENGAEPHLFLSASKQWGDYLEAKGYAIEQKDLLSNRLVVVVPSGSQLGLNRPEGLLSDTIEHLALADVGVPAGIYAEQALTRLHLWDALKGRVVRGADVRETLIFVERGEAEAGIVYATDAAITNQVRVAIPFDRNLTEPIRYPLVLTKTATENEEARELYRYLSSDAAAAVFKRYGFTIVSDRGSSAVPRAGDSTAAGVENTL